MDTSEDPEAPQDPSEFPLGELFKDATSVVGKEFRLGFLRKTSRQDDTYAFTWPGVLDFLSGMPMTYDEREVKEYQLPLDEWAVKNKDNLRSLRLKEFRSTDQGRGQFEWHLHHKGAQLVFSSPVCLYCRLTFTQTSVRIGTFAIHSASGDIVVRSFCSTGCSVFVSSHATSFIHSVLIIFIICSATE